MKKITKTTNYWLLKPVSKDSKYYYIRCQTEGILHSYVWFVGYENHMGLISSVGSDLTDDEIKELEIEFQNNSK